MLQKCAESLAIPYSHLYQLSFSTGTVPKLWKLANITPIFKKGSTLDPANYRPVSLTSVPCKVMEKIIRNTIFKHLINENLISESQHGFVDKKSCITNLLETLDYLTNSKACGKIVDLILLDADKAFDTVAHRRLLLKLECYGIRGKLLSWIKSFISNRQQRVVLGDAVSDWCEVSGGVPQGCVLSPLLFVIFVNDLPDCLSESTICKMFADDTKIFARIDDLAGHERLQDDLNSIVNWTKIWLMRLNTKKCKTMRIDPSRRYARPKLDLLHGGLKRNSSPA